MGGRRRPRSRRGRWPRPRAARGRRRPPRRPARRGRPPRRRRRRGAGGGPGPWPSAWPSTARTVTSPRRTSACADQVGPADHADRGLLRQGHRQLVGGGVVLDGLDAAPRLGQGIGRGQRPGAQPPERARGRVALDDAAAGGDQAGRIEAQPGQRAGRLPHHQGRVGARGPGHVPQPLDRVHLADPTPARATVPRRGERSVPGADADPDPGRGPNARAVADHLPPGLRRASTRTPTRAPGSSTPRPGSCAASPAPRCG